MIQSISVSITLILIYRQLKAQRHAIMVDALFRFAARWDGQRIVTARKEACDLHSAVRLNGNLEGGSEIIASFFEELGSHVKAGTLAPIQVWNQYSYYLEHYWPMLSERVSNFRHTERDPTWFENFEDLYHKMQRIAKKRGVYVVTRSDDDVRRFISGELKHVCNRLIEFQTKIGKNPDESSN